MEQSIEIAFGRVLRNLRKKLELSQERLGFDAGLGRTYISELELGEKQPSLNTVFKLAKALKVDPAELVAMVATEIRKN